MSQTVLLVAHPGAGHLNPLISIASRLRSEGHHPVFAGFGPPHLMASVKAAGFAVEHMPAPISALGFLLIPYLGGMVECGFVLEMFTAQPTVYARRLAAFMERSRPAVVVADCMFPGAGMAADMLGIPWVSVYHVGLAYDGPGIPPFGSGLPIGGAWGWRGRLFQLIERIGVRRVHRRMAAARRSLHLPYAAPEGAFWTSPWLTLLLTAEDAEAPRHPLPDCTFFSGPCIDGRTSGTTDFPYHRLDPHRPKIYVSMGTVFNRRPQVFRRILRGLAATPFQIIVAAGASYKSLSGLNNPPNLMIFERVPQTELLPHVDAVVTHGGNNTVTETLTAGKPMLVLPTAGEQGTNASRVVFLGAGLRADANRSRPEELCKAVKRLVLEDGFKQSARRVAKALAETDGSGTACRFIERLMEVKAPIRRPSGYPATVTRDMPPPWACEAAAR